MEKCTLKLSLSELLFLPTAELSLQGSDGTPDRLPSPGDPQSQDDPESGDPEENDDDEDEDPEEDSPVVKGLRAKINALEKEKERHYKRREAAEKRADDAEAELARIRKDGAKDEDLQQENDRLIAENNSLREKYESTIVDAAFLANSTYKWRSPKAALKLLDRNGLEISEDGSIDGLEEAISRLATEESFLLDGDDPEPKPKRQRQTPPPPGNKQKRDNDSAANRSKLFEKYPGLRR